MSTNEAFSCVAIDAQVRDQGWEVENPNAVRYEYVLPDKTKADHVLCVRHGRALAVIEARRSRINPADAALQARAYADQIKVPFIFLANGREVRFWDYEIEAHPRLVKTFFSQADLDACVAALGRELPRFAIRYKDESRLQRLIARLVWPFNRTYLVLFPRSHVVILSLLILGAAGSTRRARGILALLALVLLGLSFLELGQI